MKATEMLHLWMVDRQKIQELQNSEIDLDKKVVQDTEIGFVLQVRHLWVLSVSSEEGDLLKVYWKGGLKGVLFLDLLHDSESFDLDMGVVDLHSLAVTILAGCTFHEHSMKVVELVHLEAHLEVP